MADKYPMEDSYPIRHAALAARLLRESALAADEAGADHARLILNCTALHVEEEIAWIVFWHNEGLDEMNTDERDAAMQRFRIQKWEARKAAGLVP